jgi:zinc transporter 9
VHNFEQSDITQEEKEKVDRPLHLMPGFTTLVGILVHSSADRVALGAAAFAESTDVGTFIALAIVLHKAPTAFGLSSFLLKSAWSWNQTRKGVSLFAAAAPLVATVAYLVFGGGC